MSCAQLCFFGELDIRKLLPEQPTIVLGDIGRKRVEDLHKVPSFYFKFRVSFCDKTQTLQWNLTKLILKTEFFFIAAQS